MALEERISRAQEICGPKMHEDPGLQVNDQVDTRRSLRGFITLVIFTLYPLMLLDVTVEGRVGLLSMLEHGKRDLARASDRRHA